MSIEQDRILKQERMRVRKIAEIVGIIRSEQVKQGSRLVHLQ